MSFQKWHSWIKFLILYEDFLKMKSQQIQHRYLQLKFQKARCKSEMRLYRISMIFDHLVYIETINSFILVLSLKFKFEIISRRQRSLGFVNLQLVFDPEDSFWSFWFLQNFSSLSELLVRWGSPGMFLFSFNFPIFFENSFISESFFLTSWDCFTILMTKSINGFCLIVFSILYQFYRNLLYSNQNCFNKIEIILMRQIYQAVAWVEEPRPASTG